MSEFKSVILGLCIASVALGSIHMLRCNGSSEKSVRFSFAVIFLCITVLSVTSIIRADFSNIKISSDNSNHNFYENIVCVQAEYLCAEILKSNGFNFDEINIFTDKTEDGSIIIKRITVESSDNSDAIKKSITDIIETGGVDVINER